MPAKDATEGGAADGSSRAKDAAKAPEVDVDRGVRCLQESAWDCVQTQARLRAPHAARASVPRTARRGASVVV